MSYILLRDGTRITLSQTGPKKQAIATNNSGKIIYTGTPSFTADDKTLLEEAAITLSPNATLDDVVEKVIDEVIPKENTSSDQENNIKGNPTGSYAILNNGFRVEIYKEGVRKQIVVRDKLGNIKYVSSFYTNVKDEDMIDKAVNILNNQQSKLSPGTVDYYNAIVGFLYERIGNRKSTSFDQILAEREAMKFCLKKRDNLNYELTINSLSKEAQIVIQAAEKTINESDQIDYYIETGKNTTSNN